MTDLHHVDVDGVLLVLGSEGCLWIVHCCMDEGVGWVCGVEWKRREASYGGM